MTPLQKLAMGLTIVVLDAHLGGFDAVPDVLGWLLVAAGLLDLRAVLAGSETLLALAAASTLVSVALLRPGLAGSLTESTGWVLSLPQLAFSIVVCGSVATLAGGTDRAVARRLVLLRGVFVVLVFAPPVLYGAEVAALLVPLAVATVAANVFLVYLLFSISTRPYALSPADDHAD